MLIVERRLENENQFVLFPHGLYGKAAISSLSASRLLFNVKRIEKATTNFNDCPSPPLLRSAKAFPTRLIINRVRFSLSIVPFQARNPYRIRGTTVYEWPTILSFFRASRPVQYTNTVFAQGIRETTTRLARWQSNRPNSSPGISIWGARTTGRQIAPSVSKAENRKSCTYRCSTTYSSICINCYYTRFVEKITTIVRCNPGGYSKFTFEKINITILCVCVDIRQTLISIRRRAGNKKKKNYFLFSSLQRIFQLKRIISWAKKK